MHELLIRARGLKKSYTMSKTNVVEALRGVDMDVTSGAFMAIVGPSGCGKSTLLHILGLLDLPDAGELTIDGVDIMKVSEKNAHLIRAKKIGFVFQGFNLLPTLTGLENVMLAARYGGLKLGERKRRAVELLEKMGLGDRMNHKPNELSGGQQQRVALARALVNNPAIILADEPTGELDTKTSLEIMELLKALNRDEGRTFVIVTHNPDVAAACPSVFRLQDGRNV